jgi:hypothetical protein
MLGGKRSPAVLYEGNTFGCVGRTLDTLLLFSELSPIKSRWEIPCYLVLHPFQPLLANDGFSQVLWTRGAECRGPKLQKSAWLTLFMVIFLLQASFVVAPGDKWQYHVCLQSFYISLTILITVVDQRPLRGSLPSFLHILQSVNRFPSPTYKL